MSLRDEIVDGLKIALEGMIEGAEADLKQFTKEVATDMTEMIDSGEINPDLINEWGHQLQLIGEANRLVATNEAYEQVARIAALAIKVAIAAA